MASAGCRDMDKWSVSDKAHMTDGLKLNEDQ